MNSQKEPSFVKELYRDATKRNEEFIRNSREKALIVFGAYLLLIFGLLIFQSQKVEGLRFNLEILISFPIAAMGMWRIWFNPKDSDATDKEQMVTVRSPLAMGFRLMYVKTGSNLRRYAGYYFLLIALVQAFVQIPAFAADEFDKAVSQCRLYATSNDYEYVPETEPLAYTSNIIIAQRECMRGRGYKNYEYGEDL